jgi:hypothetical protein
MDLKVGILAIAVVAIWLCCILAQVMLISAIGITAILWMAFAASCALGTANDDETVIVGFVPERDIL